jgi:hypothetical protein
LNISSVLTCTNVAMKARVTSENTLFDYFFLNASVVIRIEHEGERGTLHPVPKMPPPRTTTHIFHIDKSRGGVGIVEAQRTHHTPVLHRPCCLPQDVIHPLWWAFGVHTSHIQWVEWIPRCAFDSSVLSTRLPVAARVPVTHGSVATCQYSHHDRHRRLRTLGGTHRSRRGKARRQREVVTDECGHAHPASSANS